MENLNNVNTYNYQASPGLGIIFPAKTFFLETQKFYYIISPARFDEREIKRLKEIKKQIIVIAPNNFHNIGLAPLKENIIAAKFFGPKRSAVQSKVELEKTTNLPKDDELEAIFIKGNKSLSETVFIHRPSKSLIVTDLLFNMHNKTNLTSTLLFKMYGTYKKLGQSVVLRLTAHDKKEFLKSIKDLTKLDFENVLLNHGEHISKKEFDKFVLSL